MTTEINWNAPIEAVHINGLSTPATYDKRISNDRHKVSFDDGDGQYSWCFEDDGQMTVDKKWRLRNTAVVSPAPMEFGPEIKVDGKQPEWLFGYRGNLGYERERRGWFGPGSMWTESDITENGDGWKSVTAIRLPANHPYYNLTTHTYTVRPEDEASLLASDPLSRSTPDERAVAPELVARMIELVKNCAEGYGPLPTLEARAIVAALEPVDPDVEIARHLSASLIEKHSPVMAANIRAGDGDSYAPFVHVLAAIKRGRQLEKEGK